MINNTTIYGNDSNIYIATTIDEHWSPDTNACATDGLRQRCEESWEMQEWEDGRGDEVLSCNRRRSCSQQVSANTLILFRLNTAALVHTTAITGQQNTQRGDINTPADASCRHLDLGQFLPRPQRRDCTRRRRVAGARREPALTLPPCVRAPELFKCQADSSCAQSGTQHTFKEPVFTKKKKMLDSSPELHCSSCSLTPSRSWLCLPTGPLESIIPTKWQSGSTWESACKSCAHKTHRYKLRWFKTYTESQF